LSCSSFLFDDPELIALGWSEHFAAAWPAYAGPYVRPGRVMRVDRSLVRVRTVDALLDADPGPVAADGVCTGDWVAVHTAGDGRSSVIGVLPRSTVLRRAAADGRSEGQALAANADTVALVEPLVPDPDLTRMERLLVLLWETGATPLVVLTKADLVPDVGRRLEQIAAIAPGVEVIAVSSTTGAGLDALALHVAPGRTLALVGRSGAGKSTLCNRLVGTEVLEVQAIREVDGKGRHTTVRRELLAIPGGGAVLDTPGLRGAGLWAVDEGVERVFSDVEELAERCRFADCAHGGEPGCAVLAAVADGTLSERRLESWRKLGREAEWIASRTDARLRQERQRHWKQIHREMRRSGTSRP
jgi:ribosome biogenesis GTPase